MSLSGYERYAETENVLGVWLHPLLFLTLGPVSSSGGCLIIILTRWALQQSGTVRIPASPCAVPTSFNSAVRWEEPLSLTGS